MKTEAEEAKRRCSTKEDRETNHPLVPNDNYDALLDHIGTILANGRAQAGRAVNTIMVQTYWHIGKYIVEYEQAGNEKAEYGSETLKRLSRDLTDRYGKGFSKSNIYYMRCLFLDYPIFQTLSGKLSWSHYIELLKIDDPKERSFYQKE